MSQCFTEQCSVDAKVPSVCPRTETSHQQLPPGTIREEFIISQAVMSNIVSVPIILSYCTYSSTVWVHSNVDLISLKRTPLIINTRCTVINNLQVHKNKICTYDIKHKGLTTLTVSITLQASSEHSTYNSFISSTGQSQTLNFFFSTVEMGI